MDRIVKQKQCTMCVPKEGDVVQNEANDFFVPLCLCGHVLSKMIPRGGMGSYTLRGCKFNYR